MHDENDTSAARLQRRHFVIGSAASAATVSMGLIAPSDDARAADAVDGSFAANPYVDVHPDGRVVINIHARCMGQPVGTALAQIFAGEFDCDWTQVSVFTVDHDPRLTLFSIGGSTSVQEQCLTMSRMGAAARMTFLAAAAQHWGVDAATLTVNDGVVQSGTRRISYAALVKAGMTPRLFNDVELAAVTLKTPAQRKAPDTSAGGPDLASMTAPQTGKNVKRPASRRFDTPMDFPRSATVTKRQADARGKPTDGSIGRTACAWPSRHQYPQFLAIASSSHSRRK